MNIEYSPKFIRLYKKLPIKIKELAEDRVEIFIKDPFDKKLKTHKLSGPLKNYFAFWINQSYRIVFSLEKDKLVRFHTIGNHSVCYKD